MKLFVLSLVLSSTLVIVFGDNSSTSTESPTHQKQEEAAKYCNTIYPVTEDIRKKLGLFVIKGETIPKNFNTTEWCNLYCNLDKVGFFGPDGTMQVPRIFKYVIRTYPEIAPNSHTLAVQLFQVARSTKNMEDKCMKAFVAYYRFTEAVMVATLAIDLNASTDIREKVIESVVSGVEIPKELDAAVEKHLKNVETFFAATLTANSNSTGAVSTPSV